MHEYKGLFVVFDGGEGSGKSTQAEKLANALHEQDIPHVLTREPGDTALGMELRKILLDTDRDPLSKKAEALLFAADRAEHVEKIILPALGEGMVVICDRYIASTVAYQSYGNGLDLDSIRSFSDWASGGLYPDITFFLNIDPSIGLQRAIMRGKTNRIEAKSIGYHERVRHGFCVQVDDSWVVMDARMTPLAIHVDVLMQVTMALEEKKNPRINDALSGINGEPLYCPICRVILTNYLGICPNGHGFLKFIRNMDTEEAGRVIPRS